MPQSEITNYEDEMFIDKWEQESLKNGETQVKTKNISTNQVCNCELRIKNQEDIHEKGMKLRTTNHETRFRAGATALFSTFFFWIVFSGIVLL